MLVERDLVHPKILQDTQRNIIGYALDYELYQGFIRTELAELGPKHDKVKIFILKTAQHVENKFTGFIAADYIFGALITVHLIRLSCHEYGQTFPPLTNETIHVATTQQHDMVAEGTETFTNWIINEANTLMPELVGFLKNNCGPLPFETYWGIADIAQLYALKLAK